METHIGELKRELRRTRYLFFQKLIILGIFNSKNQQSNQSNGNRGDQINTQALLQRPSNVPIIFFRRVQHFSTVFKYRNINIIVLSYFDISNVQPYHACVHTKYNKHTRTYIYILRSAHERTLLYILALTTVIIII